MRVLIDERLPRKIKNHLPGHDCPTVPDAGLAGQRNGELISLAEQQGCEIFFTMDKSLEYEQNLRARGLAINVLGAKSNRLSDLLPCVPECLAQMASIKPGQVVRVGQGRALK